MGILDNKVGLITGSARGLGRACAQIFAREGGRVVVVDLNREGGEETVKLIKDAGGEATFVAADVSKSSDVQAMVKAAVDSFGGLDCAINNAVRDIHPHPLADIPEEDWQRAMEVNFTGVFLCMKYEIKAMLNRGSGAIVNIGSGGEFGAHRGLAWYIAAKHGIYGMTKVAALDYAAQGIRVNALGPGCMWTPLLREAAQREPKHIERLTKMSPMNRLAEPEEVAEAAVWLCSSKASFVTGHTMLADGAAMINRT